MASIGSARFKVNLTMVSNDVIHTLNILLNPEQSVCNGAVRSRLVKLAIAIRPIFVWQENVRFDDMKIKIDKQADNSMTVIGDDLVVDLAFCNDKAHSAICSLFDLLRGCTLVPLEHGESTTVVGWCVHASTGINTQFHYEAWGKDSEIIPTLSVAKFIWNNKAFESVRHSPLWDIKKYLKPLEGKKK